MTPEDLQTIRSLLGSPEGQKLQEYLAGELLKLRLIENVRTPEHPFAQAAEFLAQRKAYDRLAAIMTRIGVITSQGPVGRDPRDGFAM